MTTTTSKVAVAKTEMLIRKPVAEVFHAFVDPAITSKFWFTKGTGKLETGKRVEWMWEMYDLTVPVSVKSIDANKKIAIEWGEGSGLSTVEWTFEPFGNNATIVRIRNHGFKGAGDELTLQICNSTEGFALVLAGLKAWLEHKVQLNLVADRHPKGL